MSDAPHEQYRPQEAQQPSTATLLPSNQEMRAFYKSGKTATPEQAIIDFGSLADPYGRVDVMAQRWEITGEIAPYMKGPSDKDLRDYCANPFDAPRITKPFIDSGKNLNPSDPSSWTFPTRENYVGWLPGDPINPFTWATDSSKYIQEIMKQNFVLDADGKRVSIFNLDKDRYDEFKKQFGNAARHALGMGDLIFNKNMSPKDAEMGMFWHEPPGWGNSLVKSVASKSWQPYQHEMNDSNADLKNNGYASKQAAIFHDFESFARQMLTDSWKSATKGSYVIEDERK